MRDLTTQRSGLVTAVVVALAAAVAVAPAPGGALAQTVNFEPLMYARETTALLERDGVVVGGIAGGGLVFWPVDDPAAGERLTAGTELSGNDVTDLAWSGRYVWVATMGGGLTRIADVGGTREFRQFASNSNALNVTSVAGVVVGQSERVYYGLAGGGVGRINDGIPGTVYTTNDGLISDDVTSVQVYGGDLFVGTPVGVSRFANNLFTAVNTGLIDLRVNDLALESDGSLLAGTEGGLFRWNEGTGIWSLVGGLATSVKGISCADGLIYVRTAAQARVYNGSVWQTLSVPAGSLGAIHAGEDFWIGGTASVSFDAGYPVRNAYLGRLSGTTSFDTWQVVGSQVQSASGVALSGDVPYIGAQIWESVISRYQDDTWEHFRFQAPTGTNDGERLSEGIILSMDTGPDGSVWAGLYAGTGLARIEPVSGQITLMSPTNSGLQARAIINVRVHPDGAVITMHDQEDFAKVEILVDPENWAAAGSWLALPRGPMSAVDATDVNDAVVERRDVIWFAVSDVGLVRWDINGPGAGPDDPLTWFDASDDAWVTVSDLPNSSLSLGAASSLEMGADGTIWVGGNGLLQMRYNEGSGTAEMLTALVAKGSSESVGLVNGNVIDITRDFNGHIWAATASGLNRVRGTGLDVAVDAYLDLGNYLGDDANREFYTSGVIKPLPGTVYRRIAASADRRRIIVSADQGAALLTIGRAGQTTGPGVDAAYVYPNPFLGEQAGGGLKLGGIADGLQADVEIYNLDGQLVYRASDVEAGEGFWLGTNRVGVEVATGMYLVRVQAGGAAYAFPLSVVR